METFLFLFIISIAAGFLDTLAGGGGLIALPALIMSGVSPLSALATNKLQGSMGTAIASYMMLKKKKIQWEHAKQPMLYALVGSALGTFAVQFINPDILSFVIPVVLAANAVYFLLSSKQSTQLRKAKISKVLYQRTAVPIIGFYDGMFGPGTGSFFTLSGITLRGKPLLEATAFAKPLNFATNIASLTVFLLAGKVVWAFGLTMMLGQAIGAWAGSHYLFKINTEYLRLIVVCMCLGMLARYLI